MNNPRVSPALQSHAQRMYAAEDEYRKQLHAQREADYVNAREKWERATLEKQKFDREANDRDIDQLTKRMALEKGVVDIDKQRADLEEQIYKRGIPREQARVQADLAIQEAQRRLSKPDTVSAGGTQYERPAGAPAGQPYTVSPGLPQPKEEPLTEQQSKGAQFVIRVTPDLDLVERELRYGKVLTEPSEAARDLPFIGNITVSDEYRRAREALGNWGAAYLTQVSGAAVSPSEALRNLPAFIPRAGDTTQDLIDKADRRRRYTEAVAATAGRAGMEKIREQLGVENAEYLFRKQAEQQPVRVRSPEAARLLPPGQRIILPDGTPGQVPARTRRGTP